MRIKFYLFLQVFLLSFVMMAQERTITGTVVDQDGMPLPGASVLVKGTTVGTQTDFDGNYSIKTAQGQTLVFSFVGQKTVELLVGASSRMDVTLDQDATALSEVVVTAYGVQKKESLTGSIAEIKSEKIAEIQTSNPVQGLSGKVAGVQIIADNGQPGSTPTVRFRGIGSINSSSEPLYVIDGVPFSGDLSSINTQDIASMSFLKDASASALYGNRGANGVVIITTKKGKNQKSSVTVDVRSGFNKRSVGEYDIVTSPYQYYEGYWKAIRNDMMFNQGMSLADAGIFASQNIISSAPGVFGSPLNYNNFRDVADNQVVDPATGMVDPSYQLKYRENWGDALYGTSSFTQTYVSVASGTDKSTQLLSLGYENNEGFVINSGFEKVTARLNSDMQVKEWLKIGGSLSYSHTRQKYVDGGDGSSAYSNPIAWSRSVAPIYPIYGYDLAGNPIYDTQGNHVYDDGTGRYGMPNRPYGSLQNPIATALLDKKVNNYDNAFGNVYAEFKIIDGLKFTYNLSGDLRAGNNVSFDTPLYGDAVDPNGRGYAISNRRFAFTNQQLLNYKKAYGNHNLEVLIGHESYDMDYRYLDVHKTNFLSPDFPILDWGVTYQGSSNFERQYNVEGYFSRVMYDFNDKYFLNGSLRRDASSIFHPDNRWGTFFGLGGAWRISQEDFLAGVNWLNELKLKASYGEQGNDAILYPNSGTRNYYIYQDQWQVVPNNGELGLTLAYLGNPDASWETNTNFNVGFELALLDDRITLDAEYFERKVSDMLFNRPQPLSSGNPTFPENIGDMQNRGLEASMSLGVVREKDFYIDVNINATTYQNKITRLFEGEPIVNGSYRLEEGKSRYSYYLREFAGVNPDTGATQWYTNTVGANGELEKNITENFSEAQLISIGKDAIPDVYGGFSVTTGYKGFDLTVDFAYQIGGYGMDNVYWGLFNVSGDAGRNLHKDAISKTWSPDNTSATIPRIDTNSPNMHGVSDIRLIDASYLSLQNVSLGYNLPNNLVKTVGFDAIRMYALGNNLGLWSKRQGYDPRLSLTGASSNEYSILSTVSFGLNFKF